MERRREDLSFVIDFDSTPLTISASLPIVPHKAETMGGPNLEVFKVRLLLPLLLPSPSIY